MLLLGAGIRAKVTDFGMSKLTELNPRMTGLTKCPGTPAYMSPEALLDPPVYTEKLDCFQAGVLMIQTITRKFPDPGPAMNRVKHQISPTGWINMPVPEIKRRQKHLNLITSTNQILPIAVDCLKDTDTERPSAQQICHRLSALKGGPQYSQSLDATGRERDRGVEERELLIQQLIQENEEREREVREKEREIKNLQDELQQKNDMADQRIHTFTPYVSPFLMGYQPVSTSQADGGSAMCGGMTRQYNLPHATCSGNMLKNAPSSQAGYQPAGTYVPSSQTGYQQPYTMPAENRTRPTPKPLTRTVMSIASNPTTTAGGNCFICSRTNPELIGSYVVCQKHSQLMTKQGGATAQGYGATRSYCGAIGGGAAPGIIGGIAGSGVIVGGGGSAGAGFIQAGVSNQTNPPAPRKKVLCKTAGCSFYANEKLGNFCSNCYEDYYGMKAPDGTAP